MAASGSEETSARVAAPEEAHDETDSAELADSAEPAATTTETPGAASWAEAASAETAPADTSSSSAASAKAAPVEKMWPTEAWPPKPAKTLSGDSDESTGTKVRRGGSPLPPADALPADTLRSTRERSTFATPSAGRYEGTTYSVPPMPAPATAPSPALSPAVAKPTPPMPSAAGSAPRADKTVQRRKPTRQAHLSVARLEPWSVMKFSFVISLVCFVILIVAVTALYGVLASLGVFDSLQHVVNSVTSSQNSAGVNAAKWFSASKVLGYTGLIGAMNVVLITAMATIGAVIYNLTSGLIGGIEVTLRETE
jgi:hypothetical protein